MSASHQFKAYIEDLLGPLGPLSFKRFFGGTGITCEGVLFAFIMGQTLYFRVDDGTRPRFEDAGMASFSYMTKKRRVFVRTYFAAPEHLFDEPDELLDWARQSIDVAQSAHRAKTKKKGRPPPGFD